MLMDMPGLANQSPIRTHLMWPKQYLQLSPWVVFPPFSLPGFCVGFHVSAALPRELPHYPQSRAHETPEEQRQNEEAVNSPPWVLAAIPLPVAGAGFGMDPAKPQLHNGQARKDSLSLCLVKDVDSASTDSVLPQAWLSSLQSCYLCLFNTNHVCFWGFISVYRAACTCPAKCQHWENVGSTVIPVLECYLTLFPALLFKFWVLDLQRIMNAPGWSVTQIKCCF